MGGVSRDDVWDSGDVYETYVGRWSRLVAREFIDWLGIAPGRDWLDVGCGTGALSATLLATASPASVVGVDPSAGFIAVAQRRLRDTPARFVRGTAQRLPVRSGGFDVAVSGLMLNFVPAPALAVGEMARATRPGGTVALYVWDYAGQMQMMRAFWDAAMAIDPAASEHDEAARFPLCRPEPLSRLFQEAGLTEVDVRAIDIPMRFANFDDFWTPFLGGQGSAPGYAAQLSDEKRAAVRDRLRGTLPIAADGSIDLIARAWAIRGTR